MYVVFVVVGAVVVFVAAALAVGRGGGLDDDPPAVAGPQLPEHPLRPADLDRLGFAVVLRGYRMDQVDRVLERLRAELEWRDRRIAELDTDAGAPESEPPP